MCLFPKLSNSNLEEKQNLFFQCVQSAQFFQSGRNYNHIFLRKQGELSTDQMALFKTKGIYALSYTHYPQLFALNKALKLHLLLEQMFCDIFMKIVFNRKLSKFCLTIPKSKISKINIKLLQNL